jgi:ABC-type phosphate transport system substrate-binding protein
LHLATHYEALEIMFTAWKELLISAFLLSTCLDCTSVHAVERLPAKGTVPASSRLLITGASTMTPMVVAIGKRFSTMYPGVQIEVRTTGTAGGIDDVRNGRADIGMVARPLADNESGLYSFAIARDGICLIVHKDNPVRSLTNQQVSDIYTGKHVETKAQVDFLRERACDEFQGFYFSKAVTAGRFAELLEAQMKVAAEVDA